MVFPLFSTDKFQIEIERNCENIYNFSETVIPPDEREVAAMIDQIMEYNKKFVENKGYEPFLTSKYWSIFRTENGNLLCWKLLGQRRSS